MRICFEPNAISVSQAKDLHDAGLKVQCVLKTISYDNIDLQNGSSMFLSDAYNEESLVDVVVNNFSDMHTLLELTDNKCLMFFLSSDGIHAKLSKQNY